MAGDSAKPLLDRLKDSGFFSDSQLQILDSIAEGRDDTNDGLSEQLVERGLLTPFQAERLHSHDPSSLLISGRYEIREKIGAGGMGEVYLARDRQLRRDVALKVLPGHLVRDAGAVARFEREAKAMAQLAHPNVVQAFDSGSDGERHYLVMEYVKGTNLSERIKQQGRIEPPLAAAIGYQAALGLDHAHKTGLVHRDLKPSNLLITEDDRVKILDLGLARFLQDQIDDETITIAGTGLGTPDYMAPEQFADARNADERSDVYALGCTLYHMLTGRVPFPGSSLSEKQRAHEEKPPDPILTPGVTAGVALAVQKMMAKNPGQRFQTARECAEALSPYVDVSSSSISHITATSDWDGSQLTILTGPKRKPGWQKWGGIAALAILLIASLGFAISQFDIGGDGESDPDAKIVAEKKTTPNKHGTNAEFKSEKPDPWVLTVAQDGSGRFKSINAALDKVKPGMTIRVLDDAAYREKIVLKRASSFAGITLESPKGATLEIDDAEVLVDIANVPDTTIRGFQLVARNPVDRSLMVRLQGDCRGTLLHKLRMRNESGAVYNGVELFGDSRDSRPTDDSGQPRSPIVIQDCRMERPNVGVIIGGVVVVLDENDPAKSRYLGPAYFPGVLVRDNSIVDGYQGIVAMGLLRDIHVTGNRIGGANQGALQVEYLLEGTSNVLFANNTIYESNVGFRLYDTVVKNHDIRIANNLLLGRLEVDMAVVDSGGNPSKGKGFGDGAAVLKAEDWKFQSNWREHVPPTSPAIKKAWIPAAPNDVLVEKIEGVERSPDSPDFLKPATDSKLATEGAGRTDPALPSYIGAIPPDGVPEWDWERTWKMPPGRNRVLTVSKDPKDGAMYDSINAALDVVQPWDTIRVLDDSQTVYQETLLLNRKSSYEGITLEATSGATMTSPNDQSVVLVHAVPDVTIRGFRIIAASEYYVVRAIQSDRCKLINLEFDADEELQFAAIGTEGPHLEPSGPLFVENCRFNGAGIAIRVSGISDDGKSPLPLSQVFVKNNQFSDCYHAIVCLGATSQVFFVGNTIEGCLSNSVQLSNLYPNCHGILVANNSMWGCSVGFMLWDTAVNGRNIEVANNAFKENSKTDMAFANGEYRAKIQRGPQTVENMALLHQQWKIHHNHRESLTPKSPILKSSWIPPGPNSVVSDSLEVLSRMQGHEDYLRPKQDSPLATGGAGGDLPSYAGAVPPKGVKPWDWNITWRSRQMRERYAE